METLLDGQEFPRHELLPAALVVVTRHGATLAALLSMCISGSFQNRISLGPLRGNTNYFCLRTNGQRKLKRRRPHTPPPECVTQLSLSRARAWDDISTTPQVRLRPFLDMSPISGRCVTIKQKPSELQLLSHHRARSCSFS